MKRKKDRSPFSLLVKFDSDQKCNRCGKPIENETWAFHHGHGRYLFSLWCLDCVRESIGINPVLIELVGENREASDVEKLRKSTHKRISGNDPTNPIG